MATTSYREFAEGHFLTRDAMVFCWQQYLAQRRDPGAEPLHAATLRGLPPATILSCEYDPLRDEAEQYARSGCARRAPVRCERLPGMVRLHAACLPDWRRGGCSSWLASKRFIALYRERCFDFQEEVSVIPVSIGHPLHHFYLIVHPFQHAGIQPVSGTLAMMPPAYLSVSAKCCNALIPLS